MIVSSEFYKSHKQEIDITHAKKKLLDGYNDKEVQTFLLARKYCKDKVLYFVDDGNNFSLRERAPLVKDSVIIDERRVSVYADKVDFNLEQLRVTWLIDYKSTCNELNICISTSVLLSNFDKVQKCSINCKDTFSYQSYVIINFNISMNKCFNNTHYSFVYLCSQSSDSWKMFECFNNCSIDLLVLEDVNSLDSFSLSECFKFTFVKNIKILKDGGKSSKFDLFSNRFKYMRDFYVQDSIERRK